jgi:O-antigen/teichoic acid export membrane protein
MLLQKIKEIIIYKLGVDSAIFWATANRVFGLLKGPISIYFLIRYLTPQDQGLWYTFGSLSALTVFAELGFTTIITQFVSHEYAKLKEEDGILHGDLMLMDRIVGLVRFSVRFYIIVIPIAIIILITVGYFYFKTESLLVFLAWMFFSIIGGLNLLINLFQSIYQGLDKVKKMQINALILTITTSVFNWIMLMMHLKIWALVIGNFLGVIITAILLYKAAPKFWHQMVSYKVQSKFNFFKETIPLQGRYAISWICGYFIFNLYVPATYKYIGQSQAGRLGITMSILTMITAISNNWLTTKIPKLNIYVSERKYDHLSKLFRSSFIQSVIVQIIISVGFVICLALAEIIFPILETRFLNIYITIPLLLTQLALTIISSLAVFLRAHKEEPFVWISILNAILMIVAVFVILAKYNLNVFFWTVNLFYWIIILPLSIWIFIIKKKEYKVKFYRNE